MGKSWLADACALSGLHPASAFPRDLRRDLLRALPVSVAVLPALTTDAVRSWLAARQIQHASLGPTRVLHGCLVARAGVGVLFVNEDDSEDERRFTLAHEAAHFVLEHVAPRRAAVQALGASILPVLDGERPPTLEERLSAVLDRIPMGLQVRLMDRNPSGSIATWEIEEAEQRADRLALEMLAPARKVLALTRRLSGDSPATIPDVTSTISAHFGIPASAARSYAELLIGRQRTSKSPTLELLGLE